MPTDLELPTVEKLATEILEARKEHLERQIRTQEKRDYMWLSDIHTCNRYNYYSMAEGDKRSPFNTFSMARMESGKVWEDVILRQLSEMGFSVVEQQLKLDIPYKGKTIARGRIDGKIRYGKETFPCEIKNLDSNAFKRIESVEDLFKSEWTEKYVRQLLMYMYCANSEAGLFLITDRGGVWKVLVLYLGNYLDYCEKTLKAIERAYEAKEKEDPPDRITYNHRLCGSCSFKAICLPTEQIEGGDTLTDPELEAMVARHEEIRPTAKEYESLHEDVVATFRGKPQITLGGRFIIRSTERIRKGHDVKQLDDETRKKIATETPFFVVEIQEVKAQ